MNFNVEHYLGIYLIRKRMQEEGVTNPSEEIKKFTRDLVDKLQSLHLDEKIILKDNSFYDDKGNLIMKIPMD